MTTAHRSRISALWLFLFFVAMAVGVPVSGQQPNTEPSNRATDRYEKWLDEDVRWIITPEERAAFHGLHADKERDDFIEQFWLRRNPQPDRAENNYKEEHYRRLAYANTHFSSSVPGSNTDRGRTYLLLGPPVDIKDSGRAGVGSAHATQLWFYKFVPGIGRDIKFAFVDICDCGDYRGQSVGVERANTSTAPNSPR